MQKPLTRYAIALSAMVIASLFLARGGELQYLAIAVPEEKVVKPHAPPESHRKLSKPPLDLFNEIVSGDADTRVRSLKELIGPDFTLGDNLQPPDAQIRAVQLDDDREQEFVLTVPHESTDGTYVIVADKTPDGWYAVGSFDYWYMWDANVAGRVVEINAPFVLVRTSGGGTGIFELTVAIYRLWNGRLYKTFEALENLDQWTWETKNVSATINFRPAGFLPWTKTWIALEVRTEETVIPEDNPADQPHTTHSCDGYQWVPATFSFEHTDKATQALCK